jgi:hypothetical protein
MVEGFSRDRHIAHFWTIVAVAQDIRVGSGNAIAVKKFRAARISGPRGESKCYWIVLMAEATLSDTALGNGA